MGIVNPKNEPVRVVPVEHFDRYHQENFIQDGNFCTIDEDAVVAAVHYPYEDLVIHTTDNFQYQLVGNGNINDPPVGSSMGGVCSAPDLPTKEAQQGIG